MENNKRKIWGFIGTGIWVVLLAIYLFFFYLPWSGTYQFDKMIMSNGMELEAGDEWLGMSITEDYLILELDSNGNFVLQQGGSSASGDWKKGTLYFDNGVNATISKGFGTVTLVTNGYKYVLRKPLFFFF